MEQVLAALIGSWGPAAQILMWIGVLRLIFKPLFTFLGEAVNAIPGESDNELLAKIMNSGIYKGVSYVLDLFGSMKIPQK